LREHVAKSFTKSLSYKVKKVAIEKKKKRMTT